MAIQDDSGVLEAHPLFPASEDDDDDEIKHVSFISVSRIENGKQYLAPRQRRADELRSLDQLHQEFGGGEYVLTAFHNGRISTRRKLNLPGKSKPMFDEGINSAEESRAAAVAAPPVDPMMAMMGGQGGGMMPLFMFMMQQQDKAADRQMQMILAMMQGNQHSSAEEKASARAEMQMNLERERIASEKQMAMMREMMQLTQSGNGGGSQGFTQGVEFMRAFATQQIEMARASAKGDGEDGLGSLLETLGQAFQVFNAAKGLGGGPLPEGVAEVAEAVQ